MVVHYKEVDALGGGGGGGGEILGWEIQAFPLGFELPQTIKIYKTLNMSNMGLVGEPSQVIKLF
jgi:hypothetical protein